MVEEQECDILLPCPTMPAVAPEGADRRRGIALLFRLPSNAVIPQTLHPTWTPKLEPYPLTRCGAIVYLRFGV